MSLFKAALAEFRVFIRLEEVFATCMLIQLCILFMSLPYCAIS